MIFVILILIAIYMSVYFSYYFKAHNTLQIYKKAGRDSIDGLIPIYNDVVKISIVGLSNYLIFLYFVPFLGLFVSMYVNFELAKAFGKDTVFAIFTAILPIIFIPIIAFDNNSTYIKGEV